MIPHLLLILLWAGGESSLSEYLDFETYFTSQNIAYNSKSLSVVVQGRKFESGMIDKWVGDLGAHNYADRKAASLALAEIGEPARTALQAASNSRDPEVASRASELLAKLPELDEELIQINRALALFALAKLRDPASRPLLEEYAAREKSPEQQMARLALAVWDRKPDTQTPLTDSARIWAALPADTVAVARFTPTITDIPVKGAMRESYQTQSQLLSLLLAVGELHFRRVTVAVNSEILKIDPEGPQWVASLLEGEVDLERLGSWLTTTQKFVESENDGQKYYQRGPRLIVPVSAHALLVLFVKGEGGPDPETIVAGLRGKKSGTGLNAKLKEQLPSTESESAFWVRFVAPADFTSEWPWMSGLQRAGLNGQREETGGFTLEVTGWTADEERAEQLLQGVELLASQRVGRIRNPTHPIMVPVARFWQNLLVDHELEKVWVKEELQPDYFRSLHQQSERVRGSIQNNVKQNATIQGL